MFDASLPGPASLADASDGELIDAIGGWSRSAAAAQARMFAALAERRRRAGASDPDRQRWACDPVDEAAAAVACALSVSHGRALTLMDTGVLLRDKLPRLNDRFLAGQVSERVIARIVWVCALVVDDVVWAALDEQFAAAAASWGTLSGDKLDTAIAVWLQLHDPDAIRRARTQQRSRDLRIGKRDDASGTASVWGRVNALDAAIAAQRITAMVNSVCSEDPRTMAQKRADAFGAVFAGAFHLSCTCARPECPATTVPDARAAGVVVHVVADAATLDAAPDPTMHGREPETASSPEAEPRPDTPAPAVPEPRPALILGLRGAVLPPALLAEVIARGAKVRTVAVADDLPANPGYRPLTALDEFVRARDLTCRHPGCDRPAVDADLDHSDPWPAGPTHPDNLNCKCRLHHLLKTFADGWSEQQLPDGVLRITTPTGHVYTTSPFSTLLFPSWITTGRDDSSPPPPTPTPPPRQHPGRVLMMPTRRRTRAQNRAAYLARTRALNAAQRELDRVTAQQAAERRRAQRAASPRVAQWAARQDAVDQLLESLNRPPGYQPDHGNDPPPF